jgi:hypothetical protein
MADYDEDALRLIAEFLRRVEGAIDTDIQSRTSCTQLVVIAYQTGLVRPRPQSWQ